MPGWYYIAAYLTAQLRRAPFPFTLKMLARRLNVDEAEALEMVEVWLEKVTEAFEEAKAHD